MHNMLIQCYNMLIQRYYTLIHYLYTHTLILYLYTHLMLMLILIHLALYFSILLEFTLLVFFEFSLLFPPIIWTFLFFPSFLILRQILQKGVLALLFDFLEAFLSEVISVTVLAGEFGGAASWNF